MSKHPLDDEEASNNDEVDEDDDSDEVKRAECSEMFYAHVVFMFSSCYMCSVLANWDILSAKEEQWSVDHSIAGKHFFTLINTLQSNVG